ncbi:hypothetical protein AB0D04_09565 [Streptomyces sp. NPDC048483]|uniref:hypothetical protein n=1 Tax=Streptomyces sp. NPDC048483 TaxID=3154927 RepID=UPI00341287EF
MMQRTRSGRRKGIRAVVAAGLTLASIATLGGCAFGVPEVEVPTGSPSATDSYDPYNPTPSSDSTPSSDPTYEDTYSPEPTEESFDPDGSSDVDGTGCDFSESRHTLMYTVQVRNPSLSDTYSYDITVVWLKDKPADGNNYGSHRRSITVGPGDTETYDAEYTISGSNWNRFWFKCHFHSVVKSRG